MQGTPFRKEAHLPYSKWSQHRAGNGLIYLAHPVTGEVKWLWSRHHDPKTEHDYLVNTVTGQRQWVTKENAHFCPVKPNTKANTASSHMESITSTKTNPFANSAKESSASAKTQSSTTNHFVNMPTSPAKVATPSKENAAKTKPKYREIAAPKSLGLTADEALMLVPETGRRYIFNKKTKTSRWLPDRVPDTTANERRQKPLFRRSKELNELSSQLNNDDGTRAEVKMKTKVPTTDSVPHGDTSSNGVDNSEFSRDAMAQPSRDQDAMTAGGDVQAGSNLNGQGGNCRTSQPGDGDEDEDEDDVDEVSRRLGSLNTILADVSKMTTSDRYNMAELRKLSTENPSREDAQTGSQRLLELEEYLTQNMLKVDAVESEGNQIVRAKRKEAVKAILALTEEIERLRKELSS